MNYLLPILDDPTQEQLAHSKFSHEVSAILRDRTVRSKQAFNQYLNNLGITEPTRIGKQQLLDAIEMVSSRDERTNALEHLTSLLESGNFIEEGTEEDLNRIKYLQELEKWEQEWPKTSDVEEFAAREQEKLQLETLLANPEATSTFIPHPALPIEILQLMGIEKN